MKATKRESKVIEIPAKKKEARLQRVAIYARVSTFHESQEYSLETQKDGLERIVRGKENCKLVKTYIDRGSSGTSIEHRKAFNQMMRAARSGKFDLIVTKSISRFSRNVIDAIVATRELKKLGVEVYFQSQDISSLDSDSELIFSLLATFAQEESRNLSENIKWGIRRKMEKGEFSMPYKIFLGYKKGVDGKLEIVEEEAEIVRKIYKFFLRGLSINSIASVLTEAQIPSPMKRTSWCYESVRNILTNEKYSGNALLQKTYSEDFLTHKRLKNVNTNGKNIKPQYYVEGSHPAIIEPEVFAQVQAEIARRKMSGARLSFYG